MPEAADPAEPWFRDGLRFECTRCGKCCTGAPGYVWMSEDEIAKMAAYLGEKVNEFRKVYTHKARGGISYAKRPMVIASSGKRAKAAPFTRFARPSAAPGPFGKATWPVKPTGNAPKASAPVPARAS